VAANIAKLIFACAICFGVVWGIVVLVQRLIMS